MRSSLFRLALGVLILTTFAGSSFAASAAAKTPAANAVNHAHSIVVMGNNPNHVLMGAHYHLYSSANGGKTWHALVTQMMLSLAPDPVHLSTLYAVSLQKGLEKSVDGGVHWTRLATIITQGHITGVVFDARTHTLLAYGVGIYRSVDSGAHWSTTLPKESIYNIAVSGDGTAYASSSNGLLLSKDAGVRWSTVTSIGNQPVVQVAASGKVAYAIAAIALMKSTNDGHTWKPLAKAPAGIEFMGVAPSNPNEIYGELGAQGFVISRNGGATWVQANTGITDRNFNASVVRVAPSAPNIVYTAAWGLHFYASRDGGRHWTRTATLPQ